MARALGKAMREFKEAANSVQREIHESATVEEHEKVQPKPDAPKIEEPKQPTPPDNPEIPSIPNS